jgi:hypothetical protein
LIAQHKAQSIIFVPVKNQTDVGSSSSRGAVQANETGW